MTNITMFRCERKALSLTQGACSRLWLSAKADPPKPWEGRAVCVGCAIGARLNGKTIELIDEASEAIRDLCNRCFKGGRRLIRRDLCISCYNRDREARLGLDRKGHRPILCDLLRMREIVVCQSGRVRYANQRASSHAEIMLRVVKTATGPVAFGPILPSWVGPQSTMRFGALPQSGRFRRRARRRGGPILDQAALDFDRFVQLAASGRLAA